MKKKLAVIITHPIQYFTPVFKELAQQCNLHVFYTWGKAAQGEKFDHDFQKEIAWDIPLLDGYPYTFLKNTAKEPGSHHFFGIQNPDIVAVIKTFNPQAILIYGWAYQSHLKVLRYFRGKIPLWFRGDSTLLDVMPFWKRTLRKIYLTLIYKMVDKAFYVGSAGKAYFLSYGLNENQLVFSPHAVDNRRFAENRSDEANSLRQTFGIGSEDILILFAGKFEPRKNPLLLLNAFIETAAQNTHLLFVGNGILESGMKAVIDNIRSENSSKQIVDQIHFIDFQNQSKMPVCYQACDVFCLPSNSETWGLSINEAMAAGKAVMASEQVGCAPDLIKNNENGYIFKNQAELKVLIKQVAGNRKLLAEMGKASSQIIKNWSIKQQVVAFTNELENLKNG
ncbi:glycosyltransferase family 4 protein [Pedobacter sp. UBA5917]|uniref:glycosyltransferase family 4 protein n=1 Tax=Pedobacter sp. UBA5917 TaxID=1947061 RepID=UPI0025CE524D|nr:glycosyltransferase family 4 protein [Pedobacter sp. UBA5917]